MNIAPSVVSSATKQITGVILAGGQGRRFAGRDKGWLLLAGQPLIKHVLTQLQPQVGAVLINANRHQAEYAALGVPVIADDNDDFAGPLAGIVAGLRAAKTEFVVFVPCDAPKLPPHFVQSLWRAKPQADIAVASVNGRPQYVCALIPQCLWHDAHTFLASGGNRMQDWFARHTVVDVAFDNAVLNINTPEQLAAFSVQATAA